MEIITVETDWKSESEDVLYAVREGFSAAFPELAGENFDALAENYAAEETEDFINALGQELSVYGLMLYQIASDSDSYLLTVIRVEEEDAFKKQLKEEKKKGTVKKQPRKKPGDAAKRIDLSGRIVCEKFSLPKGYSVRNTIPCIKDQLMLDFRNWSYGEKRRFDTAILDIGNWPPSQGADLGILVRDLVDCGDGRQIASVSDNAIGGDGYLIDKKNHVVWGQEPQRVKEWKQVCGGCGFDLYDLFWFAGQLFLVEDNRVHYTVYLVENVENSGGEPQKVLEVPKGDARTSSPDLFVMDEVLYLRVAEDIYRWVQKDTDSETKGVFEKEGSLGEVLVSSFTKIDASRVAYEKRPEHWRGESDSELVVLDLKTFQETKYPAKQGLVQEWRGKVCVLFVGDPTKNAPILECFDLETGKKRVLKYGALGKESIRQIYETA